MSVRLERAHIEQRDVVARLLEFNSYEFSRIDGRALDADGTYGYEYLDSYFSVDGRLPYLIRVGTELGGLALVRRVGDELSVAEFLVLPKFRRRGIGTTAARLLFTTHPGRWRVRQAAGNQDATGFWRRAIPRPFEETRDPDGAIVHTFDVSPPDQAAPPLT